MLSLKGACRAQHISCVCMYVHMMYVWCVYCMCVWYMVVFVHDICVYIWCVCNHICVVCMVCVWYVCVVCMVCMCGVFVGSSPSLHDFQDGTHVVWLVQQMLHASSIFLALESYISIL